VQSYSGVTSSPNVNTNGIIIRGNSPKGLLWMLDGVDLLAEGPFKKGSNAAYLFNYRYSVFGFLRLFDESMKNKVPAYQDLSFKLNFPTKNLGTFSIFRIGGITKSKYDPEKDSTQFWNI
jgi:hypothetical protein